MMKKTLYLFHHGLIRTVLHGLIIQILKSNAKRAVLSSRFASAPWRREKQKGNPMSKKNKQFPTLSPSDVDVGMGGFFGDIYLIDLSAVTTIAEASFLWRIPQTTLHGWCCEGKIAAIQVEVGATWLISVRCLIDMFGPPHLPDDGRENLRDFHLENN